MTKKALIIGITGQDGAYLAQHLLAKGYAVTGKARHPGLPNVPTTTEAGLKGFELEAWVAVFAPAGTPPEIIRRVNTLLVNELKTPNMRDQMIKRGAIVSANTPEEFSTFLKAEIARWTKVAKAGNISID